MMKKINEDKNNAKAQQKYRRKHKTYMQQIYD